MPKVDHKRVEREKREKQEKQDAQARIMREFINRHLHLLSNPRTREVLQMRYGYTYATCHTLEEVGACFGVTRERVRQIQVLAEEKITMFTIEKDVPLVGGHFRGLTRECCDTLKSMEKVSDTERRVWLVSKNGTQDSNTPKAEQPSPTEKLGSLQP